MLFYWDSKMNVESAGDISLCAKNITRYIRMLKCMVRYSVVCYATTNHNFISCCYSTVLFSALLSLSVSVSLKHTLNSIGTRSVQ